MVNVYTNVARRVGAVKHAYLGLFNGTICIPQIVAAALGGVLLGLVGSVQSHMMILAGVALVLGALSVSIIHDKNENA